MNPTLLTIFTWAGDKETTNRNKPTWENRGADLQFVSPVNAPCHLGGIVAFQSQKFGPELMRRIRVGMAHALSRDYQSYVFTEADSVVLRPIPPKPPIPDRFHAFFYDTDPSDTRFHARHYCHFAWWMARSVLARVHRAMLEEDMGAELGFADRLMGLILEKHDILSNHDWQQIYSRNELVDDIDFEPVERTGSELIFVHGVKNQHQHDRVLASGTPSLSPGSP